MKYYCYCGRTHSLVHSENGVNKVECVCGRFQLVSVCDGIVADDHLINFGGDVYAPSRESAPGVWKGLFEAMPGGLEVHTGGIMNPLDTWAGDGIRSWLNAEASAALAAEHGVTALGDNFIPTDLIFALARRLKEKGAPFRCETHQRYNTPVGEHRHHLYELRLAGV